MHNLMNPNCMDWKNKYIYIITKNTVLTVKEIIIHTI